MSVRSAETRRRSVIVSAAVASALALPACTAGTRDATVPERSSPAPVSHWSYGEADGPDRWAGLSSQFATCGTGSRQSPVALTSAPGREAPSRVEIELPDAPVEGSVVDTGHTYQFTSSTPGTVVTTARSRFDLVQLHHHGPSEHTLDGTRHPVELHLVHADASGGLLVLALFVTAGPASEEIAPFVDAVARRSDADVALDLHAVLSAGAANAAATYDGSLTTPPCTEDVSWVVLTTPVTMSEAQLDTLVTAHPGNARPIQPLGTRTVTPGTVAVVSPGGPR